MDQGLWPDIHHWWHWNSNQTSIIVKESSKIICSLLKREILIISKIYSYKCHYIYRRKWFMILTLGCERHIITQTHHLEGLCLTSLWLPSWKKVIKINIIKKTNWPVQIYQNSVRNRTFKFEISGLINTLSNSSYNTFWGLVSMSQCAIYNKDMHIYI